MAENEQLAGAGAQGIVDKALEVAEIMAGKDYRLGGRTTAAFDCSGFVSYVLKALFPQNAGQLNLTVAGFNASALFDDVAAPPQKGDLIIFIGGGGNHMGIVLDETYWIGSQSSTGVAKVRFTNGYWGARRHSFRRIKLISQASVSLGLSGYARRMA